MKHDPHSAAIAARSILEHTSRIAKTWPEYREQRAHSLSLAPRDRPDDKVWANAYQAYRLAAEQLCGAGKPVPERDYRDLTEAIQKVMPELFSDYWETLPAEGRS